MINRETFGGIFKVVACMFIVALLGYGYADSSERLQARLSTITPVQQFDMTPYLSMTPVCVDGSCATVVKTKAVVRSSCATRTRSTIRKRRTPFPRIRAMLRK